MGSRPVSSNHSRRAASVLAGIAVGATPAAAATSETFGAWAFGVHAWHDAEIRADDKAVEAGFSPNTQCTLTETGDDVSAHAILTCVA